MFWPLDTDDFHPRNSPEAYPLIKAAHRIILGGDIPTPGPTTVTTPDPTAPVSVSN